MPDQTEALPVELSRAVAVNVRTLRTQRSLTQGELAHKLRAWGVNYIATRDQAVNQSTISMIERYDLLLDWEDMRNLARVLGVTERMLQVGSGSITDEDVRHARKLLIEAWNMLGGDQA